MRGCLTVLAAALVSITAWAAPEAGLDQAKAERAAVQFGQALMRGDATGIRPLLPERGKVRLRLECMGPEVGSYSGSQVEALFKDFLRQGSVQSFRVGQSQSDPDRYAMVHGRASVTDRDGRVAAVDLHLKFQPEAGHWVLREIRESRP